MSERFVSDPRRDIAKRGFELGQSLRTIAAQAGVTEGSVRLWAKQEGWVRGARPSGVAKAAGVADVKIKRETPRPTNLTPIRPDVRVESAPATQSTQTPPSEVAAGAKCVAETAKCVAQGDDESLGEAFRRRVRELLERPAPSEAADVAARAVVQVVMTHRTKANRLAGIVDRLASQLELAADSRDLLESLIIDETEPGKRRAAMLRLVSLPSHAGTIRDLATAFQKLVLLERQAFGLGVADDPTPPPPPAEAQPVLHSEFDRIRERVRLRLAQSTPEPGA